MPLSLPDPVSAPLLLNLILIWLALHLAAELRETRFRLKSEMAELRVRSQEATQIAILEQAMLFDREVRKVQQQLVVLRAHLVELREDTGTSPDSQDPPDLLESFVEAKKKGLRRMCIIGRGWLSLRRVQLELGLSDTDVKMLIGNK